MKLIFYGLGECLDFGRSREVHLAFYYHFIIKSTRGRACASRFFAGKIHFYRFFITQKELQHRCLIPIANTTLCPPRAVVFAASAVSAVLYLCPN